MVFGEAAAQESRIDHASKQGFLVFVLEAEQPLGRYPVDGLLLFRGGQVEIVIRAALQRLPAAAPREDEIDRRQDVEASQLFDDLEEVVRWEAGEATHPVRSLLFLGSL